MRIFASFAFVMILGLLVSPARALDLETDVQWFSWTGWDHTMVAGGGQAFMNVIPGINATVNASGSFTLPSSVKGAQDRLIISGHSVPGTNTFEFMLSAPLQLIIQYRTVDDQEKFTLVSAGSHSHTHLLGAPPTIMTVGNTTTVMGKDHGVPGPGNMVTGAAEGYFQTSAISSFSISHEGLRNNKFEAFQMGIVIPEPESVVLALLGLAPLTFRRKVTLKNNA